MSLSQDQNILRLGFLSLLITIPGGLCWAGNDLGIERTKTLFQRGRPTVYSKKADELKYIGMPIGGICAGQVYLGGDGKLWYWDIFNVPFISPGNPGGDSYYVKPMTQNHPLTQGFAIKTTVDHQDAIRTLDTNGFKDIQFQGQYPLGIVHYADEEMPVTVRLEAFSPFIPTDAERSGLPAIILQYTVTNTTAEPVQVELAGWLENPVCKFTGESGSGRQINRVVQTQDKTQLQCTAQKTSQEDLPDEGSMALTLMESTRTWACARTVNPETSGADVLFGKVDGTRQAEQAIGKQALIGALGCRFKLDPGQSRTRSFLISWYFPNLHTGHNRLSQRLHNHMSLRAYYAGQFDSAWSVADYICQNASSLIDTTKLWRDTWYDSTLPYWFLDRTFINTSSLASTVFYRFHDLTGDKINEGRLYGREGVYLGDGTCTHVLHYEQAIGRIFPALARQLRAQVDYGLSFREDGVIRYRAEFSHQGRHYGSEHAVDGHCGTILRTYREHTTAPDMRFLQHNWAKIKKSIQVLIQQDKEKDGSADGILEGPQYNTLDRVWYGKIPWISTLYCAALHAGAQMAQEMDDLGFARQCQEIAQAGYREIPGQLFNGEYFIQVLDPEKLYAPNVNQGCHIDQMLGQSWAWQLGLGRILPRTESRSALNALFKYNFHENIGEYHDACPIKVVRHYALDEEAGTVICSFPRGGADLAPGRVRNDWEKLVVGYFSECMTGFSYQAAGHMIWEGLVERGFAMLRAIHERYHASKRNPFNEIEYGNHYSRAMASYGVFLATTGFAYHGPKGYLSFAPRLTPDKFKAAFTTAEGWGSYEQERQAKQQSCRIHLKWGKLRLAELAFVPPSTGIQKVTLLIDGQPWEFDYELKDGRLHIRLKAACCLRAGQALEVHIRST
jgi:non-lysosomal glucosylceramidase